MRMYKMRFHKRWTSKFFSKYEDPEFPFWECYWGLICKELKSYKSSLVYTCPEPNATGALLTGECCYTRILNSIWSPRMCGKAHGSTKITKVVLEKEKKRKRKSSKLSISWSCYVSLLQLLLKNKPRKQWSWEVNSESEYSTEVQELSAVFSLHNSSQ